MLKKSRINKLLSFILCICLFVTMFGTSAAVYAEEESSQSPAVYFQYENGEKIAVPEGSTITLNNLDKGHFVLEGTDVVPKWSAKEKIYYEDNTYENHNYINAYSGIFQPASLTGKHAVSVTNEATGKLIYSFFLETTPCNIDQLKIFVDGSEVSEIKPCITTGAEAKYIVAKGRITGTDEYVTIPVNLLNYSTTESKYEDKIDRVDGSFWVPDDSEITFVVSLVDNKDVEARFFATSKHIPVTGIEVRVPETWEIHAWNGIFGNMFVGINEGDEADRYSVSVKPYNASIRKVVWEALTPDIAEFVELHGCGIVPKKNGLAKFRVYSAENKDIYQDVEINFVYKEPLTQAAVGFDELVMSPYTSKELVISTTPENASEKRFVWTYSEDGIVKVSDEVTNDPSSVLIEKTTSHYISAQKEGTVTVTGTPYDQSAGAKPVVFTVNVKNSGSQEPAVNINELTKNGIDNGLAYLKGSDVSKNAYGCEWNIISLERSGVSIGDIAKEDYIKSVEERVEKLTKPSDIARVVLALGTLGKNPEDIKGVNLIEKLYSNEKLGMMTSNMPIWTLIALDSHDYSIPDGATWTRKKLIDTILTFQTADGGFGLNDNKTDSTDMTGMALQSLAPYYNDEHKNVVNAVDKAIAYLEEVMTDNCGFVEGGSENSCTVAQIITALSALGIDCTDKSSGFTWGNKSMITNICSFATLPNGFKIYASGSDTVDEMSTQQVTYALTAYDRMIEGKNALYDLTDVVFESSGNDDIIKPEPKPEDGKNFADIKAKITVSKATGATKVKLTWKKIDDAQGYTVYRATSKSGAYRIAGATAKASEVTFTDSGLKAGGTYYYKVKAYTVKKGALVETKSANTVKVCLKPAKVKISKATAISKSKIKLTWKKANGAAGYVIYRKAASGKTYKKVKTISKSKTVSYVDTGLKKGKKYSYKIKAYRVIKGKKVYGPWSKVKTVQTKGK